MTKVPYVFQNTVRNVYFDLLKTFFKDVGLTLDMEHYKEDAILPEGFMGTPAIVAIIDSHSVLGEPDDLTNESSPRGLNGRKYEGLKIIVKNNIFRPQIEKFADNMRRQILEDVVVD